MAGPGLKPNVKLVLEPGAGAQMLDEKSNRSMALEPDEGRLLALLMPDSTAETLANTARAVSIPLDVRHIEMLLARLEANGFYERPPRSRPQGKPLSPDDAAPQFRGNLEI